MSYSSSSDPRGARPSPRRVRVLIVLGMLAAAAVLVLFPFDWLGNVWPAYASVFDVVFATSLSHIIGHATLFFLCGCLLLIALPRLRAHPRRYLGVMLIGAFAQEALQSLFNSRLPTIWDGRDLLLDLTGIVVAYLVLLLARRLAPALAVSRIRMPEARTTRKDQLT
jgi:hypothetical protein